MPMAISFVGASVIFKLIYDARPVEDKAQIGLLNAIWTQFDGGALSVLFLQVLPVAIVVVFAALVAYAGYVIVRPGCSRAGAAAASKGAGRARRRRSIGAVPDLALGRVDSIGLATAELPYGKPQAMADAALLEQLLPDGRADLDPDRICHGDPFGCPARYPGRNHRGRHHVDGANPFQIFFRIKVPQIMPTIVGRLDDDHARCSQGVRHRFRHDQRAVADAGSGQLHVRQAVQRQRLGRRIGFSAIVIMLLVTPILVWNVYNARKGDALMQSIAGTKSSPDMGRSYLGCRHGRCFG